MQFLGGHHFDVPSDEFRRQADILPPFADGKRELIFVNQDQDPPKQRTDDDVIDIGRLHGIGDQHRKRFVPTHDVNSLAREFFDDVLDS